ncbi:MAG: hypothetical protein JSR72_23285 [Proteobacteria bacterium]|nr:hypothetical protein [Pseudomonadota bacterium]
MLNTYTPIQFHPRLIQAAEAGFNHAFAEYTDPSDRPCRIAGPLTGLHLAAHRGDPEAVEAELGATGPNTPGPYGLTALHLAARRYGQRRRAMVSTQREEVVIRRLIDAGANSRARDFLGYFPITWCEGMSPTVLRDAMHAHAEAGVWPSIGYDCEDASGYHHGPIHRGPKKPVMVKEFAE